LQAGGRRFETGRLHSTRGPAISMADPREAANAAFTVVDLLKAADVVATLP